MISLKVITGGQTGVDTGALKACESLGVKWEAVFPKGRKRESPAPTWLTTGGRHGVVRETDSTEYEVRTRECVNAAGVLLIHAPSLATPGTKLTLELARRQGMQRWWAQRAGTSGRPGAIAEWLAQLHAMGGPIVLMVAGPRASKWPDGEASTFGLMYEIIKGLR